MTGRTTTDEWVDRFRGDGDHRYVTDAHVDRAAKVLERIGERACRLGFEVPSPDDDDLRTRYADDAAWAQIAVRVDDVTYFMRVQEICGPDPQRRVPMSGDPDTGRPLPLWLDERPREFIGTGRLLLSIRGAGDRHCRKTARDTATSTLEEKLDTVMGEFHDAAARRREGARMRGEWEAAKTRARERYTAARLLQYLDEQSERHQAMVRRHAYLSALERSLEQCPVGACEPAIRNVARLRELVDAEDPGLHPERLDLYVEPPTDGQLEPFLDGWSAHGPYRIGHGVASSDARDRFRPMIGPNTSR